MNHPSALFWSFVATIILTTALSASRGLGLTRMDIPFMLGTMFTPDRDRAQWVGFFVHALNGWIFAIIYVIAFHQTGWKTPWFGMLIGLVHALFVLTAGMRLLPAIHPRMGTEEHGPDAARILEPPGFFAMNYGGRTAAVTLVSHVIYGGILGYFYSFPG